jgi:hypothetical protein
MFVPFNECWYTILIILFVPLMGVIFITKNFDYYTSVLKDILHSVIGWFQARSS